MPSSHPPVKSGKVGVLLVNLGTPEGTSYRPMRRYLAEFLKDRRVIEVNRAIWYPILYGIILNRRPQRVGKAYQAIWNKERDESFLRTYTRSQAEQLGASLARVWPEITVDWGMRYGEPSIASRIAALQAAGCDRILLFPLYPQYAAATTATVNDKAFEALQATRWQPALRTVPPYFDDPAYIDALAQSVRSHLSTLTWEPEVVVASFHGIPQRYFDNGDPYYCHCHKTARLLREALGMDEQRLVMTFQSRFGREEWIKPYTDATIGKLARDGVRRIAVVNPGFVSDCLETLEEIAVEARHSFIAAGGKDFAHIPCLNDTPGGMAVIEAIVRRELMGWT
jgi:protoporphyrin/coproporphyrin ferrochelatase